MPGIAPSPQWALDEPDLDALIGALLQQKCPLPVVLNALCRLFDASADGFTSGIVVFDRSRSRVRYAAGPGLPYGYNELLEGHSLTGVPASNAASPPMDDQAAPLLFTHSPQPCRSSPIVSLAGELLGIFSIYRRDADQLAALPALSPQFTHLAGVAIERARAEEVHRRRDALHATAQLLSSTGSFSWRPASDEILWSEEVYRIYALDASLPPTLELIASRIHPDDLALFQEMTDRARGGSQFEYEHRLCMPDGRVKYLRVIARATRDEDGQLEYLGAIQDVTQRRLCEETLDKVRSELARVARVSSFGALTASIVHEVVQPLSGIITNAGTSLRMLAADPPNVEGASESVRRTIRDGGRAYDVIARMRALITRNTAPRESVDLNHLAREVVTLLLSELQGAGAVLQLNLSENLPPVAADKVQLQQVIINLLLNASEAMRNIEERPRQLLIQTRQDPGHVSLSVQDSGVGLPEQDLGRLFEAFYTTKTDGIGIGLFVSRAIIEWHQGRLWAEPNQGPGATFSFSIPCS
jgi:signal transduction histidine kinase